jgi:D-beta-D-heptose 7-phosphate kinase/D-beta-D-heptose 1-phosphate adenosyltransferase
MKIGFANGCFDGLHAGHKFFLDQCRFNCDFLIVAINSDRWIAKHKGAGRPLKCLEDRIIALDLWGLTCGAPVSILPFDNGKPELLLREIRPDIVFRGWDQDGSSYCEATRTPLHRVPRLGNYSTTLLAS